MYYGDGEPCLSYTGVPKPSLAVQPVGGPRVFFGSVQVDAGGHLAQSPRKGTCSGSCCQNPRRVPLWASSLEGPRIMALQMRSLGAGWQSHATEHRDSSQAPCCCRPRARNRGFVSFRARPLWAEERPCLLQKLCLCPSPPLTSAPGEALA